MTRHDAVSRLVLGLRFFSRGNRKNASCRVTASLGRRHAWWRERGVPWFGE